MVNFEQIFPGSGVTVQPSRWEHFLHRLRALSRNAVRAWVADMLAGTPFANVLFLSTDELRVLYEGKQPVPTVDPSTDVVIDKVTTEIIGGAPSNMLYVFGSPVAVNAVAACNWATDDPTQPQP